MSQSRPGRTSGGHASLASRPSVGGSSLRGGNASTIDSSPRVNSVAAAVCQRDQDTSWIDHDLPWEMSARGWQCVRSEVTMYDTQSPTMAIEKDTIPPVVSLHNPFACPVALERRHEKVSLD